MQPQLPQYGRTPSVIQPPPTSVPAPGSVPNLPQEQPIRIEATTCAVYASGQRICRDEGIPLIHVQNPQVQVPVETSQGVGFSCGEGIMSSLRYDSGQGVFVVGCSPSGDPTKIQSELQFKGQYPNMVLFPR